MGRPHPLIVALVTASVLGVGAVVLQRWIAQSFQVAVALVVVWFVVVAVGAYAFQRGRPGLRLATLGTVGLVAIGSIAIGYWTALRKNEVNEQVVVAVARADGEARLASLAGAATQGSAVPPKPARPKPAGPVELARGAIEGADGHSGSGTATVISVTGGDRMLTLTDLDVAAGPDVNVYLSETTDGIEGAIELGDLKGEVGNQGYEIPADADLTRFDDVVLYCIPFTTRIATAPLR